MKTIQVEEINALYRKLSVDPNKDFQVRTNLNTGNLANNKIAGLSTLLVNEK
ncbi:hypothetical protein ACT5YT_01855 [Leuconostoc suionicum]|uniref:hypothetical protein n=1 Tax=Leuconostoc suionicum TaxID=1511761 RepID=UPI004035469E